MFVGRGAAPVTFSKTKRITSQIRSGGLVTMQERSAGEWDRRPRVPYTRRRTNHVARTKHESPPMLCLVHGYALTGSGSNQWSRSIAEGMVENGETVHLICQERRPEELDFVAEAFTYDAAGQQMRLFRREVSYDGSCVIHRPELEILPTYVRPQASDSYMVSILDLTDTQIDEYLRRNEAVLHSVLARNRITAVQVNHVVLMAAAVSRACSDHGIPFGILPHGSAIEYVVKHDERMHRLAADALASAQRIFVLSDELRERVRHVFPDLKDAAQKMVPASAGVHTRRFRIIDRPDRPANVAVLEKALRTVPRGKSRRQRQRLRERLRDDLSLDELLDLIAESEDYPPKLPDAGVEHRLDQFDWLRDDVISYVGKIIGHKGLPSLIAAFPSIAAANARVRLIIAGRGNLREGLEALVYALGDGRRTLVEKIVGWGGAIEGEREEPFHRVAHYFEHLASQKKLDAYFEAARRFVTSERILFTGYMEHDLLRHLFPCADVAIFPSIVKEAAPLVIPEAMASGCFPIGSDYAGMAASLDVAAEAVPPEVGRLMRLRHDPEFTVRDIVDNGTAALAVAGRYRASLREVAVRRYDWRSVAADLASEMRQMSQPGVA